MGQWSIDKSAKLYNLQNWGLDFFKINEKGNIEVKPDPEGIVIDLKELIDDLQSQNVHLPILVRFSDILKSRIEQMYQCFAIASQEYEYQGKYFGIYPIKVNQQRQVVEEIVKFGTPYHFGLEAGSKPELHAVLALLNNPNAPIICNGYKDETFIRMAIIGQRLDKKIILVVEKLKELDLIIRVAQDLGISPQLGLRVKSSTLGSGYWESSSGEHSKFGLNATEIMEALEKLKKANLLEAIQLLHFHLGSQITDIRYIKQGLQEIRRYFVELSKLGCNIQYIDVGGGLGVDYDGSRSVSASSMNYSIQEYANDIVYSLKEICEAEQIPHPHILSESGRALTAHHSVFLFNVLETTSPPRWNSELQVHESDDSCVQDLLDTLENFESFSVSEAWNDAQEMKEQLFQKFNLGIISLAEKAKGECLFWTIARKVYEGYRDLPYMQKETEALQKILADKYFCNFSVFQSIPDSWAIDQAFPIMPIHRLKEQPLKDATLQDITCDSDGAVNLFVGAYRSTPTLPVHGVVPEEQYILGIFLVGAYQEILGDLHNLFGDTNTVNVLINEDGSWNYEQIIHGEDIADVLRYVQFEPEDLLERMSQLIGISLGKGLLEPEEGKLLMKLYREGLQGYTYLVH